MGNVRYNTHLYGGRVLASDGRGPPVRSSAWAKGVKHFFHLLKYE